jgi:hypothetical protein
MMFKQLTTTHKILLVIALFIAGMGVVIAASDPETGIVQGILIWGFLAWLWIGWPLNYYYRGPQKTLTVKQPIKQDQFMQMLEQHFDPHGKHPWRYLHDHNTLRLTANRMKNADLYFMCFLTGFLPGFLLLLPWMGTERVVIEHGDNEVYLDARGKYANKCLSAFLNHFALVTLNTEQPTIKPEEIPQALEKLNALVERGILEVGEFQQKKQELLQRL